MHRKRTFTTKEVSRRFAQNDFSGSKFDLSDSTNLSDIASDDEPDTPGLPMQHVGGGDGVTAAMLLFSDWLSNYKQRSSILVDK